MSEAPVLLWPELAGPGTLVLDGPAQHYLCNVLRLRAGLDWLGALGGRVLEADPLAAGAAQP